MIGQRDILVEEKSDATWLSWPIIRKSVLWQLAAHWHGQWGGWKEYMWMWSATGKNNFCVAMFSVMSPIPLWKSGTGLPRSFPKPLTAHEILGKSHMHSHVIQIIETKDMEGLVQERRNSINGVVQDRRNSIANALELRFSCSNHRYVTSKSLRLPASLTGCPNSCYVYESALKINVAWWYGVGHIGHHRVCRCYKPLAGTLMTTKSRTVL